MWLQRLAVEPSVSIAPEQSVPEPRGITLLDNVLFIAGFACGFVLHQNSGFRHDVRYSFTTGASSFRSLLGGQVTGWLWALVVGVAFLIVGRRFRYGGRIRPAEWLAVVVAIVLLDSAIWGYRPESFGRPDPDFVSVEYPLPGSTAVFRLFPRYSGESRTYSALVVNALTVAAALVGAAGMCWRKRACPGARALYAVAFAALVVVGPIRLVEGTVATEYTSAEPFPGPMFNPGGSASGAARMGHGPAGVLPRCERVAGLLAACVAHPGRRNAGSVRLSEAPPRLDMDRDMRSAARSSSRAAGHVTRLRSGQPSIGVCE